MKKIVIASLPIVSIAAWLAWWLAFRPVAVVYPALDTSARPGQRLLEGSFWLKIGKPLNSKTLVRYIVPLDSSTGRPLDGAGRIVFYAPYNGDAPRLAKALPQWLRRFADEGGCTVFSLTIQTDKNPDHLADRKSYYVYPEAGWMELVFGIERHLRSQFGLADQRLLVVGESSGGSMAQMMALRYPEHIESAAWHGGSRYDRLQTPVPIRMLAINSWADYAMPPTAEMAGELCKAGQKIDFLTLPPIFHHDGSQENHAPAQLSYDLIYEFTLNPEAYEKHARRLPMVDFADNEYYDYPITAAEKARPILLLWNCRPGRDADLQLQNLVGALAKYGFAPSFQRMDYMSDEEVAENVKNWRASHAANAIILAPAGLPLPNEVTAIRFEPDAAWLEIVQALPGD